MDSENLCDEVLMAIRRIVRAIDLQSRELVRRSGLTGPQHLVLRELINLKESTVTQLAERINLSQATVTDILNRLEKRELIKRYRSDADKRYVCIRVTEAARDLMKSSPPLLQEKFVENFLSLKDWEQLHLLAALQQVAFMMDARNIDASPVLSSGPITANAGIDGIATHPLSSKSDSRFAS